MNARCTILPDPRFADLRAGLVERLRLVGHGVSPENFASLMDPLMRGVLVQGFAEATAHEGSVWLLDDEAQHLVVAYNTGPNATRLVTRVRQPVNSGLIGMVLANEQPLVENEVFKNARQNKTLDTLLRVQTYAQIAVPFYLLRACRGVISAVQLKGPQTPPPDPPGFSPAHLASAQRAATLLTRLLEYRLLSDTVGWTAS